MALSILSKRPVRLAALIVAALNLPAAQRREVVIAAAANLADVLPAIGSAFETASGIHPVFSSGSTAQLALQIENGAPFDVFLAADTEHIDELIRKGLLIKSSRAEYARGVLALWIPPQSKGHIGRVEDLVLPSVRTIAIANPQLAPYGQASIETLTKLGIWEKVKSRAVYAGSIATTKQYGITGNADAVFSAWPLVFREKGRVIPISDKLHRPLNQALGIVSSSVNIVSARVFTAFLLSAKGQVILAHYGYGIP